MTAAVRARPTLTDEQTAMVSAVCSSGHGIEVVEGAAGAGKTFALAAAREAWKASGFTVLGCSLAARAAKQLEDDAGIPSATLHRVLTDLDAGRLRIDRSWVVVVDEAAMVGTRQLARLVEHTSKARAKVVLVGDPHQLPEIDAGGAFRGLQARLGASQLRDNRRQAEPWEREAVAELRAGDTERAVDAYLAHDRVHTTNPHERLVADWLAAWDNHEDVLMVAARMTDVDRLNHAARAALQGRGDLSADLVVLDGRGYAVGDQVLALRSRRDLGVLNGTRGEIIAVDTRRHELTIRTTSRQDLTVPFAYAIEGHLTHGYATTIHKAQGATVERCLALLDDTTTREAAYTALSRGRRGNDAYLADLDRRADERHASEQEPEVVDRFRSTTARSAGETMAIDQLRIRKAQLEARLADGPEDVRQERADLEDKLERTRGWLGSAESRRDRLQTQLDGLGLLGHRAQRCALKANIANADRQADKHHDEIDALELRLGDLVPPNARRLDWERQHRAEIDELSTLRRQERTHEALRRELARAPSQQLDHGLGLEL